MVFLFLLSPVLPSKAKSLEHLHGVGMFIWSVVFASVAADFDFALALLHNFWYARALEASISYSS